MLNTPNFSSAGGTGGFLNPDKIVSAFGVEEGMSVADFGCGSGYFTILLGKQVGESGRVYALDIQDSALDAVKNKAGVAGIQNIETRRANLETLGSSGLADDSQDVVLLANILFQSSKKADILKESKRVLKEGGRLIVIDWRRGSGGFGPPNDIRTEDVSMRVLVSEAGFLYEDQIDAGQFHYGLIFKNIG